MGSPVHRTTGDNERYCPFPPQNSDLFRAALNSQPMAMTSGVRGFEPLTNAPRGNQSASQPRILTWPAGDRVAYLVHIQTCWFLIARSGCAVGCHGRYRREGNEDCVLWTGLELQQVWVWHS